MSKNLQIRSDGSILLKDVRASYLHVFEPWAKEGETKKFSGRFIIDPETHGAELAALKAHVTKLEKEAFKERIPAAQKFLRNGDDLAKEEFEGKWYVQASEKAEHPPELLKPDRTACKASDDLIYSGAFVNVIIMPWIQNNKHGKRVNANLKVIQFKRKGDKFGNGAAPVDQEGLDDEEFEGAADDIGSESDDGF